jgi:large subunit ribosomal protein L17
MRHRKSGRRLGRTESHRKALMKNLTVSLIREKHIVTGLLKAKELRGFAEPLITMAKTDSVANRRRAFAKLRDDEAVRELFAKVAPANAQRPGGYTRILRMGNRVGDGSQLARVELVGIGEYKED